MWDGPKFLFEGESLEKISLQATVVPALRKEREERGTHCVAHVSSKAGPPVSRDSPRGGLAMM